MKTTVPSTLGVLALLLPCVAAAQTFKCVDTYGKITYSGKKCSDLGLKDAGEVKDRLNINPALPVTAPEGRPRPASAPSSAPETKAPEPPAEEPPPQRRCFVVSTPKGPVTRCNDTPPSDAPPPE